MCPASVELRDRILGVWCVALEGSGPTQGSVFELFW